MFIPKMPPRRCKGTQKAERKPSACLDKGWFEFLVRHGVLAKDYLGAGEFYSRLRLRIRSFDNLHCRYQQSRIYQVTAARKRVACDDLQRIKTTRDNWAILKKRLRPQDLDVLDYCTFEPVNYRLTEQQRQELGQRVRPALNLVADVLATDINNKE